MQVVGVIPIFMSAGAAVLPTLLAAITSVVAILFKPRELVRQFRLRPALMSGITVSFLAIVTLAIWWMLTPAKAQARTTSAPAKRTDWSEVARTILIREKLQLANATATATATGPTTASTQIAATTQTPATIAKTGPDFSRTMFTGTVAPTKLQQLWKYRPDQTMFLADPVLSPDGKRLYVAGCINDLAGYIGILACLDVTNGTAIWEKVELNGDVMKPFFSSPSLTEDGKSLLIGQGLHADKDCSLMCFDTEKGDLKWAVKTTLHIESSPAIFGDMAVVGAGAIEGPSGMPTGDPGYLFAVRISDGKKLWQQPINDAESSPVIDSEGTIYMGSGFNGNAILALRSETDEELKAKNLPRIKWKVPAEFPVTGALSLVGDIVIAGGGNSDMVHSAPNPKGQIIALNRKTGDVLWKVTPPDSILGSMAAGKDLVICPCRTGEVLAIHMKDGSIAWRTRINAKAPIVAGIAFGGGKVYGMSNDGYLGIIDVTSGELLEKIYINEPGLPWQGYSMCTPQVVNGRLIVGSETGGIRMYVGEK